eukprot:3282143-Pyramimonas_sp.AAC.1
MGILWLVVDERREAQGTPVVGLPGPARPAPERLQVFRRTPGFWGQGDLRALRRRFPGRAVR